MQVTNRPDINALLSEMRAMRAEAQDRALAPRPSDPIESDRARPAERFGVAETNFKDVLRSAVNSVNDLQLEAGRMTDSFVRGEQQDLVATMVAVQKANVAFQAATQIRNRLVSAYQDIMNMTI